MSGMMISTHFIEVKMNLEKIGQKLIPILDKNDLSIYSIKTKKEFGKKILEILIDVETMDINELEKIHLEFVETLEDDDIDDDFFIELSSLGAERPLKTPTEVEKAISKYIYVKSSKYKGYGTLLAFDGQLMTVEINEKARMKKIEIKFDDATELRTAIKF
jgi:ribosome maturation factor RimP